MDNTKRDIIISEDIGENIAHEVISRIVEINRFDSDMESEIIGYEREPINLVVNSFGGSVYDGLGIIDAMRSSETPIITYSMGKTMSMGFFIFLMGHKRLVGHFSTLMYHEISSMAWGKITEQLLSLDENLRLQDILDELVIVNTGILQGQLDSVKASKEEWYITPVDAIKMGIADDFY